MKLLKWCIEYFIKHLVTRDIVCLRLRFETVSNVLIFAASPHPRYVYLQSISEQYCLFSTEAVCLHYALQYVLPHFKKKKKKKKKLVHIMTQLIIIWTQFKVLMLTVHSVLEGKQQYMVKWLVVWIKACDSLMEEI